MTRDELFLRVRRTPRAAEGRPLMVWLDEAAHELMEDIDTYTAEAVAQAMTHPSLRYARQEDTGSGRTPGLCSGYGKVELAPLDEPTVPDVDGRDIEPGTKKLPRQIIPAGKDRFA